MEKIEIVYVPVDMIYGIRRTKSSVLKDTVDYYDFDTDSWRPDFHPGTTTSHSDPEEVLIAFETLQGCLNPEVITTADLKLEIANQKLSGDSNKSSNQSIESDVLDSFMDAMKRFQKLPKQTPSRITGKPFHWGDDWTIGDDFDDTAPF
jgi:hypothetical protein